MTVPAVAEEEDEYMTSERLKEMIADLTVRMKTAAGSLEFEEAARLRDEIRRLEASDLGLVQTGGTARPSKQRRSSARKGKRQGQQKKIGGRRH